MDCSRSPIFPMHTNVQRLPGHETNTKKKVRIMTECNSVSLSGSRLNFVFCLFCLKKMNFVNIFIYRVGAIEIEFYWNNIQIKFGLFKISTAFSSSIVSIKIQNQSGQKEWSRRNGMTYIAVNYLSVNDVQIFIGKL